ncbi:MAG: hypothetical protein CM15mV116_040 [uncultured marine virus]|nr:MAG: hypothetical protein CM15mV116_040 [uncultured marine virus]
MSKHHSTIQKGKRRSKSEGLDPNDVHSGWIKSKNASLYFKMQVLGQEI